MKNKITANTHGNECEATKGKRATNLQKNGFLNFQVALIISMLSIYGVFQIPFAKAAPVEIKHEIEMPDDEEFNIGQIKIERPQSSEQKKAEVPAPKPIVEPIPTDVFKIDNDVDDSKTKIASTDTNKSDKIVNVTDLGTTDKGDEVVEILNLAQVKFSPIFPGCEGLKDNTERTQCLSEKIAKIVQRNFDAGIASDYGLSGTQKIYVQFLIDENGVVTDIQTRAPIAPLGKEAERVIKKIPKLQPGKQDDKSVKVRYSLPIIFNVKN